MSRPVPEWVGATDTTTIPPRVKLRIVERQNGRCTGCGRAFDVKLKPLFDHRPALINGGQNRESMIEAVCEVCHSKRTKVDVALKALAQNKRKAFLGIKKARAWQKYKRKLPNRDNPHGHVVDRLSGQPVKPGA